MITWLSTETYHPPAKFTPNMVAEILELSDMIVPLEVSPLFPTIEKHMMEELVQVSYNIPETHIDVVFAEL